MAACLRMSDVMACLPHTHKEITKKLLASGEKKIVIKLKKPLFVEYIHRLYGPKQHKRYGTVAKVVAVRFARSALGAYGMVEKPHAAPRQLTLACDGIRNWNVWIPLWSTTSVVDGLEISSKTVTQLPPDPKTIKKPTYTVAYDIIGQELRVGDIGFHPYLRQSYVVDLGAGKTKREASTFRGIVEVIEIVGKNTAKLRPLWGEGIDWVCKEYKIDLTKQIKTMGTKNMIKLDANEVLPKLLENKLSS